MVKCLLLKSADTGVAIISSMKKIIILFLITGIFASCRNEKKPNNENVGPIKVDTLSYRLDSVKTVSKNITNLSNSPFDTPKAVIKFPVFAKEELNNFVKRKVYDFFDEKEKATSFQDLTSSFINGYDSFIAQNPESKEFWQLLINLSVVNQEADYVAVKYLHYDFVGGAHGNTNVSFLNYKPSTNEELLLDSLILPNQRKELAEVAERIFRKDEKLSPTATLENYFFTDGKFSIPDRFYVSKKGLVFLYVPYEIKPYAAGITNLVIPFEELKTIARPKTILSKN